MKKILWIILCILAVENSASAQYTPSTKESVTTASDLKTGNSQDVLSSFFQLAVNDLFSNGQSLKFQSSLFAIKAKTDPSLWQSEAYLKQAFARNFVFGISPAFDSNYRFKSNTLNVKYAIVNKRDKTVFNFILDHEDDWNDVVENALNAYATIAGGVKSDNYKLASHFFDDMESSERTSIDRLPEDFIPVFRAAIDENPFFKGQSFETYRNHLQSSYNTLATIVENKPLWIIEGNFTSYSNGQLFSKINIATEYLKGLIPREKMNIELDTKAAFDAYHDSSTAGNDLNTVVMSISIGFNWIVLKNRNEKSLLEVKGNISGNHYFMTPYYGFDENRFMGNGTVRIRVTNDIWIPVNISYDPQSGVVFGRISFTSNFSWLRNSSY